MRSMPQGDSKRLHNRQIQLISTSRRFATGQVAQAGGGLGCRFRFGLFCRLGLRLVCDCRHALDSAAALGACHVEGGGSHPYSEEQIEGRGRYLAAAGAYPRHIYFSEDFCPRPHLGPLSSWHVQQRWPASPFQSCSD